MTARSFTSLALASTLALLPIGCGAEDPLDGESDSFSQEADAPQAGSAEAAAVLRMLNDTALIDFLELDDAAGLHRTAARNIIAHRDGPDGIAGTADDDPFDDLAELDAVSFVGPLALELLVEHAVTLGLLAPPSGDLFAMFSPLPLDQSHNAKVAELIRDAEFSVDIAMYSFSDSGIQNAIADATSRGVRVRFLFETANTKDKKLSGAELDSSKSGKLEAAGANVRFVNKIMHHKYMIVDGPRFDLADAATATLVSGSANWSRGAASIYDENTVFMTGNAEANLLYQREFDLLWNHSRDLVADSSMPFEITNHDISDADIAAVDDPDFRAIFTSDNFTINQGSTTFRLDRSKLTAADALVAAIEGADESIWVASGHMRLRPVAEALIAKVAARPDMDIRVYLDGQEFISFTGHNAQAQKRADCLAGAVSDRDVFNCNNKSFLYGKQLHDAGVDVRFKYYAFRWHFSYAVQMHHKFLVIDGDELYTGSYNLSINAEHNTFENIMHVRGPKYAGLIETYKNNFLSVWETGRAQGLLETLRDRVSNDNVFPIVFDSMALSWPEVSSLKGLIIDNCAPIFSVDFRTRPEAHSTCAR